MLVTPLPPEVTQSIEAGFAEVPKAADPKLCFPDRFLVRSEGSFIIIPFADVVWIEAQGDYVKFHAGARSCLVRMTMKALTENLDSRYFLRVHRSSVVGVAAIEKIRPVEQRAFEVVLRDGTCIRVGAAYRDSLRIFYNVALGGNARRRPMPEADPLPRLANLLVAVTRTDAAPAV